MVFLILLSFVIVLLVFFIMKQYQIYKIIEHIPGPTPLPLIGNALELGTNTEDLLININRIIKKYGNVVRLCIGAKQEILVSDPKYISQIFTAADSHYKGDAYDMSEALLGKGIITSTGETWARQRKILNQAFSNKQLRSYVTIINNTANKLVKQLKDKIQLEFVDVTELIFFFTLNSICKAALKIEIDENSDYKNSLTKLIVLIFRRFQSPIKRSNFFYRFTSDFQKTKECVETIHKFLAGIIQKRKREYHTDKSSNSSILDEIFRLKGEDMLTDEEVLDQVKAIIAAGSDTVGTALSFAVYILGKHPEIQNKILKEVEFISDDDVNYDDLQQLKYTECVFKEILRMYNPVSFITRVLPKTIYLDGMAVPENTTAIIYLRGVHMSEDLYPEPEKFDPDRFLVDRNPNSFIPFAGGPRICLGQKFALLEGKLTLAKIVKNFEISTDPQHKIKLIFAGVLKSSTGLPVKLRLRRNAI